MKKVIKILSIIIPIILFLLISIFISADKMTGFESWFYTESVERMSPLLTNIMKAITHIGDPISVVTICLILFVIPNLRKDYAIPVSITVIISACLSVILKYIFVRERPDILRLINETSYSFPSGHSMNNMALYSMIILLVYKQVKNKKIKICIITYCIIVTILIGFSRVYLGVHYITDVIGGWCAGFSVMIIVYYIWNNKILNKISTLDDNQSVEK